MNTVSTFIPPATTIVKEAVAKFLKDSKPSPLLVTITHEPFMPWFTIEYDGQTEELDHVEALEWFKVHGAKDMEKVNSVINQAFNFHKATCTIESPINPSVNTLGYEPKI